MVRVLPHKGELLDIWDLPDDQEVYADICESKTDTVFQFGTPGAQKWLRHFNFVKKQEDGVVFKGLSSIDDLAPLLLWTDLGLWMPM